MNLSIEPNDNVTFGIAHEDESVVVIEKPARVPTQPGKGHLTDTLMNGLFARFGAMMQNLGKARDFGLLHRLDKDTSGLLIVALRASAYDALRAMFESREVRKFYWAVCDGRPRQREGVIRMPIVESPGGDGVMKLARIGKGGKPALTAYRVLDSSDTASLVEARPVTGRLHQVRIHMEAIGCPLLGDSLYGPTGVGHAAPRLALHAHRLAFSHPVTGAALDIRTDWPKDLRRLLRDVGLKRPDLAEGGADSGAGS
jgi:23S rRNA pseudouridine1911/1915/1917 synthase